MLELKNIKKEYPAGDGMVYALKGISLQFRESEFVSILGPSGCGKTTLLNIIGGLDQYTSGDLVINGKSTKDFKDRDWDTYRNHSVGFVFQSYNLIPHQTVLQNVEIALSLSGVSKKERKERAKLALEQVGLGNQLNKKPSEMSGGQMQRVAIARALVNNPDIILADEPTGALDTETSVQVMDILKEISKDRLVVMVTHNPELAETYSTRIIRILDGELKDDSAPLSAEEVKTEQDKFTVKQQREKSMKRPAMSRATAFGLSFKNLVSKRGRTVLTSFAGSIGIIGIALIFAVSQGMTTYINTIQEETLSSYPLTIESQHMDVGTLMQTFIGQATSQNEHENDAIYQKGMIYDMVNALGNMEVEENDLGAFKSYIETQRAQEGSALNQSVSGVQYSYDIDLQVYTKNTDGSIIRSDSQALMQELLIENMGMDVSSMVEMGEKTGSTSMMESMSSMSPMGSSLVLWDEMLPGDNGKLISPMLEKQYEVIYGSWPTDYDEIVLVVDENNEVDDMTLYALGLKSEEEIHEIMQAAMNQGTMENKSQKWSYEEICDMEFKVILNSDCYKLDETTGLYTDLRETQTGLQYLYDNGTELKVSGILRPAEGATSTMLSGTIGYTSELTEYVIKHAQESEVVEAQLAEETRDIFTGLPFEENTGNLSQDAKAEAFRTHVEGLDAKEKAEIYVAIMSIPSEEQLDAMVQQTMGGMTREMMDANLKNAMVQQAGLGEAEINEYIESMSDEDIQSLFEQMVREQVKAQYAQQVAGQMQQVSPEQLSGALDMAMDGFTTEQLATYYDEVLEFASTSFEDNLIQLGCVNLEEPSGIHLYASSFESKDVIEEEISRYNEKVSELEKITYTDYIGLMMSSVTSIINAITYVLVAFVGISLVVSSIMIGVITLISVQERTKEIGILRAIGASKKNVSNMFTAETAIIGFTAGALGVIVTYLLCIPINIILYQVTGIYGLEAYLPVPVAVILVAISVVLTLISGVIPSKSAAKKNPVVALRSE